MKAIFCTGTLIGRRSVPFSAQALPARWRAFVLPDLPDLPVV
jgi:hypothetical protein